MVAAVDEQGGAQCAAGRLAVLELGHELRRRQLAAGLVARVDLVAKAAGQALVEGDRGVADRLLLEELEQGGGEAPDGVGRAAVGGPDGLREVARVLRHRSWERRLLCRARNFGRRMREPARACQAASRGA